MGGGGPLVVIGGPQPSGGVPATPSTAPRRGGFRGQSGRTYSVTLHEPSGMHVAALQQIRYARAHMAVDTLRLVACMGRIRGGATAAGTRGHASARADDMGERGGLVTRMAAH